MWQVKVQGCVFGAMEASVVPLVAGESAGMRLWCHGGFLWCHLWQVKVQGLLPGGGNVMSSVAIGELDAASDAL
jgi:hypothetical protein